MAEPGHPLRTIVIRARYTHRSREWLIPVHALGRLGNPESIRDSQGGMTLEEIEGKPVRAHVETAPALHEGHHRGDGQRALAHGRQRLPDRDIFPESGGPAAELLGLVRVGDAPDLFLGVAVRFGGLVLAPLARGVSLRAEAPGVRFADELATLVLEGRAVDLLDGALGEGRGLLDEIFEHTLADHAIAFLDGPAPSEIRSAIHGVNARQPSDIAGDDAVHGEEEGRWRHASLGPEGAPVPYSLGPVANGVPGRDLDIRLGPRHGLADPRAERLESLGRDGRESGRGHAAIVVGAWAAVKEALDRLGLLTVDTTFATGAAQSPRGA